MPTDICAIPSIMAVGYVKAVSTVNRKYQSLIRFAELLENLGDLSFLLPDISGLLAVPLIDFSLYNSLRAACPFLALPVNPVESDLAALQSQVAGAYANLKSQLNLHPFNRLGTLQAQMNKVAGQVNSTLAQGASYLECFQLACSALATVSAGVGIIGSGSTGSFLSNADKELKKFKGGFLASNGSVLTQSMQVKFDTVQQMIVQLDELTAPVPPAAIIPAATAQVAIPTNHPIPLPPIVPIL